MSHQQPIDLEKERRLNRAIEKLASEEPTPGDLWPSIEARIEVESNTKRSFADVLSVSKQPTSSNLQKNVETKSLTQSWNSWVIAASLVVCVGSVSYSWMQLEKADAIYAEVNQIQQQIDSNFGAMKQQNTSKTVSYKQATTAKSNFLASTAVDSHEVNADYYVRQVDAMEKDFRAAKASLMARIAMNRASIDEALLKQIETELMEIERATLVLKKAMGRQQVDANFTNLLKLTYQQELTILTQLAKLDNTI